MKHKTIPSIQVLRGLAALAVLLMHVSAGLQEYYDNSFFLQIFSFGHAGVDLFFVISGCLMMYVHHRDIGSSARWAVYMRRRLQRIYPAYWVAFLVPFGLYFFQGRIGTEFSWSMVLNSFLLIPQDSRTLLVVSWTLVYEMLFYGIFGLLIVNKQLGASCLAIWLGMIVLFNLMHWEFPIAQLVDLRNLEFFFGMGIGWLLLHDYKLPLVWRKLSVILAVLGVIWNYFYPSAHYWMLIIPALFFILAHAVEVEQKFPKWLLYLGEISYSLYLVHVPLMLASYKFLIKIGVQQVPIAFVCCLAFSLCGGRAFHHLIEKPLTKYRYKLTGDKTTAMRLS